MFSDFKLQLLTYMDHSFQEFKKIVKLKCNNIFRVFRHIQFDWKLKKRIYIEQQSNEQLFKPSEDRCEPGQLVQLCNGPILYIDEQNANWRAFMQKTVQSTPIYCHSPLSPEMAKLQRSKQMKKREISCR